MFEQRREAENVTHHAMCATYITQHARDIETLDEPTRLSRRHARIGATTKHAFPS